MIFLKKSLRKKRKRKKDRKEKREAAHNKLGCMFTSFYLKKQKWDVRIFFFFLIYLFIYLFIYSCVGSSFLC